MQNQFVKLKLYHQNFQYSLFVKVYPIKLFVLYDRIIVNKKVKQQETPV